MQSDPAHDELVEKMARAIADQLGDDWDDNVHTFCGDDWRLTPDGAKEACCAIARAALVVARPVIREECAKVAEDYDGPGMVGDYDRHLGDVYKTRRDIAAAIRAME
jgi:hypothetical protein